MAEQVLTDFIRALRSADVRVSTGEAIDAARAVSLMGYGDRTRLADTLRCVLAKSPEEKATHDRLFDLYFSRRSPDPKADLAEDSGNVEGDDHDSPQDLLDLVESGDDTDIAMAMERAGEVAGVQNIRFSTQIGYYAQQMMKIMGLDRLESEMMDAFRERTAGGEARAEELIEARKDMFLRARQHVQQAFEIYGAGATEVFREEILSDKRITQLDRRDLDRMRALVDKMARRLAVKHSRRTTRRSRGKLDVRKTLRRNAGFDGVPFELNWKQTRKDRPKLVLVCDVSGSVARVVRFFLMLVYSLADVIDDIDTFAFSGRLDDVGDILETEEFTPALERIINTVGMSTTDYGQSLSDLRTNHWQSIDRQTTVILLGDGRSNYGDPRIDIFREAAARAKRTVWLCPEAPSQWGTGDSEMLRYKPYCSKLVHVTTMKDLERVIDEVLASYA